MDGDSTSSSNDAYQTGDSRYDIDTTAELINTEQKLGVNQLQDEFIRGNMIWMTQTFPHWEKYLVTC
jgi:hypothetical protein